MQRTKRRVDILFLFHALFATVLGLCAFLVPHVFEWVLVHHGETLKLRDNAESEQKITHLIIRLFGALIMSQGWIVYNARETSDAHTRRSIVQSYFLCFFCSSLALLRAQLTEGGNLASETVARSWHAGRS